jgi:hypothetical protein
VTGGRQHPLDELVSSARREAAGLPGVALAKAAQSVASDREEWLAVALWVVTKVSMTATVTATEIVAVASNVTRRWTGKIVRVIAAMVLAFRVRVGGRRHLKDVISQRTTVQID